MALPVIGAIVSVVGLAASLFAGKPKLPIEYERSEQLDLLFYAGMYSTRNFNGKYLGAPSNLIVLNTSLEYKRTLSFSSFKVLFSFYDKGLGGGKLISARLKKHSIESMQYSLICSVFSVFSSIPDHSYVKVTGVDRIVADFDPSIRSYVRGLELAHDEIVSQSYPGLVYTPSGIKFAPMTFYDMGGNFYIINSDGVAELIIPCDEKPLELGEVDLKDSRSTFSGVSIRNWQDAQDVLEAEQAVKKIEERAKEAEVQAEEKTNAEAKAEKVTHKSTLSRITILAVLVSFGYMLYRNVKK